METGRTANGQPCKTRLPDDLQKRTDELMRKVAIAHEAMQIPEENRTPWNVLCACAALNAQARGPIAERLLCEALQGTPVPASQNRGDVISRGRHIEIKSSFSSQTLNLRQIRIWQDVDYAVIHAPVENGPEHCRAYRLTHAEMETEINKIGGFTHGTKEVASRNTHPEHSITLSRKTENPHFLRWERQYRDRELEAWLFGTHGDPEPD